MNKRNLSLSCASALVLLAVTALAPTKMDASGGAIDTMSLSDEPGNWFKSEVTGTPFTVIKAGAFSYCR